MCVQILFHRPGSAHPVAASHEPFRLGDPLYTPERIESAVRATGGWLPEEVEQYVPCGDVLGAVNCGVFGGAMNAFIDYYAATAIDLIRHPGNQAAWRDVGPVQKNIYAEQHLLAACLDYHAGPGGSRSRGGVGGYLPDHPVGLEPHLADEARYTHLLGMAKRSPAFASSSNGSSAGRTRSIMYGRATT